MSRPKLKTVCHPERKHYGLGLCRPCWQAARYIPSPKQVATCHPERPHASKGLCNACYLRQRYQVPALRARRLATTQARRKVAYAANPEKFRANSRAYYAAHREACVKAAVARNRRRFKRDPESYARMLADRKAGRSAMRQADRGRVFETPLAQLPRETPKGSCDRTWWRVEAKDKPRSWTMGT